jgi:hypothetical protein
MKMRSRAFEGMKGLNDLRCLQQLPWPFAQLLLHRDKPYLAQPEG